MPTYDAKCTKCEFEGEIEKPREASLPRCPQCRGTLRRVYRPTVVHYAAPGFSATDGRLEKLVGTKRYRRFEAQKEDVETRARSGRLTEYERSIEAVQ